ncbi:pyridoxal phosphate-dependent aminotransferase [Labedaea rhizosphaerae]|uniref:Aminotransferase n=1 Tax=Labedaea rhizosphaerae TaxID=598644 RepID=A0A4R6S1J6_LABRH|nr:pyridoxal phosphate-dependent aminotransferase [Labedaea rhizosphaerae]TDP92857.1 aspartate aminotransferase/aminotransferase [Labedaea rhizosphaerae]
MTTYLEPRTGRSPMHGSTLMDRVGQALSIKHNNLVYEMRAAGRDVITLSLGEAFFDLKVPTFGDLEGAGADGGGGTGLHHYSHSRGLPELRAKLAGYYQDKFQVPVDPDREIIVTAGSKVAIYMVLLATLEPGDEVIIPEPFWLSYPEQVRLCRGVPVMVPQDVSIYDLHRYVTPRTRALIINNPNNPSGRVYSEAELAALHDLVHDNGMLLIADEAYNEFVPPGQPFRSCGAFDPDKEHTVTVNSMSKNYGISGWRIGYVLSHPRLMDAVLKINQHLITCAPTILCRYVAEHFDDILEHTRPQIQRVVALRNEVAGQLDALGVRTLPGSASFYLFASLGTSMLDSTAFADRLLRDSGVSVVAGLAYGESCDRYVRISVGTESPERVARGIAAVRDLIDATSPR